MSCHLHSSSNKHHTTTQDTNNKLLPVLQSHETSHSVAPPHIPVSNLFPHPLPPCPETTAISPSLCTSGPSSVNLPSSCSPDSPLNLGQPHQSLNCALLQTTTAAIHGSSSTDYGSDGRICWGSAGHRFDQRSRGERHDGVGGDESINYCRDKDWIDPRGNGGELEFVELELLCYYALYAMTLAFPMTATAIFLNQTLNLSRQSPYLISLYYSCLFTVFLTKPCWAFLLDSATNFVCTRDARSVLTTPPLFTTTDGVSRGEMEVPVCQGVAVSAAAQQHYSQCANSVDMMARDSTVCGNGSISVVQSTDNRHRQEVVSDDVVVVVADRCDKNDKNCMMTAESIHNHPFSGLSSSQSNTRRTVRSSNPPVGDRVTTTPVSHPRTTRQSRKAKKARQTRTASEARQSRQAREVRKTRQARQTRTASVSRQLTGVVSARSTDGTDNVDSYPICSSAAAASSDPSVQDFHVRLRLCRRLVVVSQIVEILAYALLASFHPSSYSAKPFICHDGTISATPLPRSLLSVDAVSSRLLSSPLQQRAVGDLTASNQLPSLLFSPTFLVLPKHSHEISSSSSPAFFLQPPSRFYWHDIDTLRREGIFPLAWYAILVCHLAALDGSAVGYSNPSSLPCHLTSEAVTGGLHAGPGGPHDLTSIDLHGSPAARSPLDRETERRLLSSLHIVESCVSGYQPVDSVDFRQLGSAVSSKNQTRMNDTTDEDKNEPPQTEDPSAAEPCGSSMDGRSTLILFCIGMTVALCEGCSETSMNGLTVLLTTRQKSTTVPKPLRSDYQQAGKLADCEQTWTRTKVGNAQRHTEALLGHGTETERSVEWMENGVDDRCTTDRCDRKGNFQLEVQFCMSLSSAAAIALSAVTLNYLSVQNCIAATVLFPIMSLSCVALFSYTHLFNQFSTSCSSGQQTPPLGLLLPSSSSLIPDSLLHDSASSQLPTVPTAPIASPHLQPSDTLGTPKSATTHPHYCASLSNDIKRNMNHPDCSVTRSTDSPHLDCRYSHDDLFTSNAEFISQSSHASSMYRICDGVSTVRNIESAVCNNHHLSAQSSAADNISSGNHSLSLPRTDAVSVALSGLSDGQAQKLEGEDSRPFRIGRVRLFWYIAVWSLIPCSSTVYSSYVYSWLGLPPQALALARLIGPLASAVGIGLCYKFMLLVDENRLPPTTNRCVSTEEESTMWIEDGRNQDAICERSNGTQCELRDDGRAETVRSTDCHDHSVTQCLTCSISEGRDVGRIVCQDDDSACRCVENRRRTYGASSIGRDTKICLTAGVVAMVVVGVVRLGVVVVTQHEIMRTTGIIQENRKDTTTTVRLGLMALESFVSSAGSSFALTPLIVMATHNCTRRWAATGFSCYMCTQDIGRCLSGYLTTGLCLLLNISGNSNYWANLWQLVLLTTCLKILPLLLLVETRSSAVKTQRDMMMSCCPRANHANSIDINDSISSDGSWVTENRAVAFNIGTQEKMHLKRHEYEEEDSGSRISEMAGVSTSRSSSVELQTVFSTHYEPLVDYMTLETP
eukprot:GHVQ01004113.1.p1 GENE.GHVQ01004113.1~~GHVQ01004113.1.p1  ORF type:complete len:1519 (+),score=258.48 GHVQ01004113.1:205-4761(+)